MVMKSVGIYKITNKINGKFYIGSSKDIKSRWYYHKKAKRKMIIHYAIKKYGIENFNFEVIENCNVEELIEREQYYYDELKPEYNMIRPTKNLMEDETIRKLHKKAMNSPEVRKKFSLASKKQWATMSGETKKRILESSRTPEAKAKRVKTMNSKEQVERASIHMKRLWSNENYRNLHLPKKIELLREVSQRPEVKLILAKKSKARWEDEEYRNNIISKTSALKRKKVYLNDGNKVLEFDSMSDCGRWIAREKGVCSRSATVCVSGVINRGRKSAYGYNVSLDKDVKPYVKKRRVVKNRTKVHDIPVVMLDENGNLLREFESCSAAGRFVSRGGESISRVCRGDFKTSAGYKWAYLKDYKKQVNEN